MQKFYQAQTGVRSALKAAATGKIKGLRFNYDDGVYEQILDRLGLGKTYLDEAGQPTGRLNILDYNVRLSPLTYHLNRTLGPQHHLLYPDGQGAYRFWQRMEAGGGDGDGEMQNCHVMAPGMTATVKANLLTRPLEQQLFTPSFLPPLAPPEEEQWRARAQEPVNRTLLFVGDFVSSTAAGALRTCLYYNEVRTSMFRYGGVKFLAWTTPNEVLKYLGPLGSIHRRTNSLMANLYADVRVVACTQALKNPKAVRLLGEMDYVPLPDSGLDGEVCLVEFQSNHNKYRVRFPDELHLIVHKLFCTPGAVLADKLHVLGPGAEEYLRAHVPAAVLQKKISMITNQEFVELSEAYYYWPFKPNTSLETYGGQESFFDVD